MNPVVKALSEVMMLCPEYEAEVETVKLEPTDALPRCARECAQCNSTGAIPKYPLTETCPGRAIILYGELRRTHTEDCCDGSGTRLVPDEVAAIRVMGYDAEEIASVLQATATAEGIEIQEAKT